MHLFLRLTAYEKYWLKLCCLMINSFDCHEVELVSFTFWMHCYQIMIRQVQSCAGEVAPNRFKAQTRSKVSGKWGVWNGKFREVEARAEATAGNVAFLTTLCNYLFVCLCFAFYPCRELHISEPAVGMTPCSFLPILLKFHFYWYVDSLKCIMLV